MEGWRKAAEYHQQTKHHFHRFARSLGYMDWANQPDPFRRFDGASTPPLLIEDSSSGPAYDAIFQAGAVETQPLDVHSLSAFLQYSMAISAWKEYGGSRWALRVNPSSGNLHPTESYVVTGPIDGLTPEPGVFHYAPRDHLLERRATVAFDVWRDAIGAFPEGTFLVGLTSIHWREVWKYGERGYRYCQHDVGHALAAIALSAAHLGWGVGWLDGLGDEDVSRLLGLDRKADFLDAEIEQPDLIAVVVPRRSFRHAVPRDIPLSLIERMSAGPWFGKANRLSREHVEWEGVRAASEVCVKPRGSLQSSLKAPLVAHGIPPCAAEIQRSPRDLLAREIFLQRRSGVGFDGATSISAPQFFAMLNRVMPRSGHGPWDVLPANSDGAIQSFIHLLLYVHRVSDVAQGLYFLVRSEDGEAAMRSLRDSMRPDFLWRRPANCPEDVPLFLLQAGDAKKLAAQVSCGQEIASDGCFAVSMIAEFEAPLREHGAWMYRRLHWEAGMIGQVLYLEAEAAGVRATGIGCFFDDPVHDLLGMTGNAYQDLYHFTIGGAVEDERLTTLAPYGAEVLSRRASIIDDGANPAGLSDSSTPGST